MNNLFNYNLKNLDRVEGLLQPADIKGSKHRTITGPLRIFSQLGTQLKRLMNLCFGDHHWYNEAKARKIVRFFIEKIDNPTPEQTEKVLSIFERLAHIHKGKVTYAHLLDEAALRKKLKQNPTVKSQVFFSPQETTPQETIPEPDEGIEEDEQLPHHLDESLPNTQDSPSQDSTIPETIPEPDREIIEPDEGILELDEEIEEEEELPENFDESLPELVDSDGLPGVSKKLLFHIHANQFGANSSLKGMRFEPLEYLHAYFSLLNNPKLQNITDRLAEAIKLDQSLNFGKDAAQKIQEAMAAKKPLLFRGGWTGAPAGHAVYYEIIPDPENSNKATFRYYNLGAGYDKHGGGTSDYKNRPPAFLDLKGIDLSKFTPQLLNTLKEIRVHVTLPEDSTTPTKYHVGDIYDALRDLLQPESMSTEISEGTSFLMSEQQCGICSWRSLLAFVAVNTDQKTYKKFKCDIKIQSLVQRQKILQNERALDAEEWRLMKKSVKKLSRSIARLYEKYLIGEAYLNESTKILNPVVSWLKAEKKVRLPKVEVMIPSTFKPIEGVQTASSTYLPISQESIRTDVFKKCGLSFCSG